MSRINRTQSYAALWLNHLGWPVEKISNELEITDNQVLGVIKKEKEKGSSSALKTASLNRGGIEISLIYVRRPSTDRPINCPKF
jgi:hypothetical protein